MCTIFANNNVMWIFIDWNKKSLGKTRVCGRRRHSTAAGGRGKKRLKKKKKNNILNIYIYNLFFSFSDFLVLMSCPCFSNVLLTLGAD